MIPSDTKDIKKEYSILLSELNQFNPELSDKKRILAITKCDLIDDELQQLMKSELPEGIETVFISAIANKNLHKLKDIIWKNLNE
jgi:GTP-binding protein